MIVRPRYRGPEIPTTYAVDMTAGAGTGIVVADGAEVDQGENSFAILLTCRVPTFALGGGLVLVRKNQSGVAFMQLDVNASGTRLMRMVLGDTPDTFSSTLPITSAYDGLIAKIAAVISVGATDTTVKYFLQGAQLGASVVAPNAGTVSNASSLYLMGTESASLESFVLDFTLLNFAPTDSEILDWYVSGMPEAWQYGSQSNLVTSPSDLTDGSWSKYQCTIDDDAITGPDGVTPADVIIPDSGVVQGDIRYNIASPVGGCTYRTECDAKAAGYDKIVVGGFLYGTGAGGGVFDLTLGTVTTATGGLTCRITPLADDWYHLSVEGLEYAPGPQFQYIGPVQFGTADGVSGTAVTNVKITKLGATLHLAPNGIATGSGLTWQGSANGVDGTIPASGAAKVTIRK